jgi:hypothetical protein
MTIEMRAVIHFFYLLDAPDENVLARLGTVYGRIVNLKTMPRWSSKFRNGTTDPDDEPRPGITRRNEKLPAMRTVIKENPYLSQKKIV